MISNQKSDLKNLKLSLRIMKLSIFFIFLGLSFSFAAESYSQRTLFHFTAQNSTVKQVFKRIEKNSEFVFFYYNNVVDLNRLVSVNAEGKTVNEILDQVFANTDNTYTISGRQIVINKTKKVSNKILDALPQQKSNVPMVRGSVIDEDGQPLVGVSVKIAGTTKGVITNVDGEYQIAAKSTDHLEYSFIGMLSQSIRVGTQKIINVTMHVDAKSLGEVTVVSFGQQKKESVVAAITTIKPSELRVPSSNLTTALAGRLAGIISYQRSGEPGQDDATFFIRGVTTFGYANSPLILIDGIEASTQDLSHLTTDDIESFSIMKDASAAALYGARGANGVIYVKTKEGKSGQTKVFVRAECTLSTNARDLKLADPITYMRMFNEATHNRDPFADAPFSTKKIDMTIKGTDPLIYPTVDWRKMMFNTVTYNQRYNASVSGGGERVHYYVSASYSKDTGILKKNLTNAYNNNIDINNYGIRMNTTMKMGKYTTAVARISTNFYDYHGPLRSGATFYDMSLRTSPVLFLPVYDPDDSHMLVKHTLFGNYGDGGQYLNPYALMVEGYQEGKTSTIQAQLEWKQSFDFLLKGLEGHFLVNTTRYSFYNQSRSIAPFYYQASRTDEGKYVLTDLNANNGREYLNYSGGNKTVTSANYLEGQLLYNTSIAKKHNISAMLVYTMRSATTPSSDLQSALPSRNISLSGRATYSYGDKYFAEFDFGYNGSERFAKKHRYGFFPAIGVGYLISNEKFYPKSWKEIVNNFKLKYTWGKVGNDRIGSSADRFFYLSNVNPNNRNYGYQFGTNFNNYVNGVSISRYADPNICWEVSTKQDLGLEMGLFNDAINIQADYFTEYRKKILMDRSYIPSTMGLMAPVRANVGEASSSGFEFSIDGNHYFNKDLWASTRINFTYAQGKYEKYEEPDYSATPWMFHKNTKIAQLRGLIAEHLFVDQYEVNNSPTQTFGDYGPGDIKYKDINGDDKIDEKDFVPIGYPSTPEITYGFGVSTGYKGFDISCFFQGSARSSFFINARATSPFAQTTGYGATYYPNQLLKVWADNHWTQENQNSYALFPRFSDELSTNNSELNTWFLRNGSFLRLKTVEMGYTLPKKLTRKFGLSSFRFYLSGNNLYTWSNFKLWDIEMGDSGLGYPIQRVYNVGINVEF
jgi:TonB-linked SusC/RagA family outer membrane protein